MDGPLIGVERKRNVEKEDLLGRVRENNGFRKNSRIITLLQRKIKCKKTQFRKDYWEEKGNMVSKIRVWEILTNSQPFLHTDKGWGGFNCDFLQHP